MQFRDDAQELEPQAGSGACETSALACSADILAGESSADEAHANEVCTARNSNIGDTPVNGGIVLLENGAAIGVLLDLPFDLDLKAGLFERRR